MFSTLVYFLFTQLAVGGLLSVALVPHAAGRSFFRFTGTTCFALLVLGLWAGPHPLASITDIPRLDAGHPLALLLFLACGAFTLGFLASVLAERRPLQKPLLGLAGLLGTLALLVDGAHYAPLSLPGWGPAAYALYFISAALFLGSVGFAMILGHWYLVVPTLPIGPLRTLTLLMAAATAARVLLTGLTLYLFRASAPPEFQPILDGFFGLRGLFFWAQILFDLLGPLILVYMIWETVKINSTQSATGLLYVATILVLIGETFSRYLFYTTRIPL